MKIGYARTSTVDQTAGLEGQERDLKAVGCERIYSEQVSSVDKDRRTKLEDALGYLREGDVLVVTKLDRLARSMKHLMEIVDAIETKGCALQILGSGIDTGTPTGRLMLNVLGSVAEFERSVMLERQREGIAKAKAKGLYKGRKPTARLRAAEVIRLRKEGIGPSEISRRLGIGRTSVHSILNNLEHS